jgi:hypothetical protein
MVVAAARLATRGLAACDEVSTRFDYSWNSAHGLDLLHHEGYEFVEVCVF